MKKLWLYVLVATLFAVPVMANDMYVNVKDAPYSAVGDGVADDSNNIQYAIDDLPVMGGGLYFPDGTYKLDTTDVTFNGKLINISTGPNVKFTGNGRMPKNLTNQSHQIVRNYMVSAPNGVKAVGDEGDATFTSEVNLNDSSYDGFAVAGYFGVVGNAYKSGGSLALNPVVRAYDGCNGALGGIEVDVDNFSSSDKNIFGIMITGLRTASPGEIPGKILGNALDIERLQGNSHIDDPGHGWPIGIRLAACDTGIYFAPDSLSTQGLYQSFEYGIDMSNGIFTSNNAIKLGTNHKITDGSNSFKVFDVTGHISAINNPHNTSDSNIVVTDTTTNNVSTSKHGFAPKLPNDANEYLDGTGAWSIPISATNNPHQTSDANLVVTDTTANNVSTSKHGFTPKLPNDATEYLDGTGEWSIPTPQFVGCDARNTGTPSIPSSILSTVDFNGSNFDTDTMVDLTYDKIMIHTAGKYMVAFQMSWDYAAGGIRRLEIWKNGTVNNWTTLNPVSVSPYDTTLDKTFVTAANAGDWYQFKVYQNSGASVNVTVPRVTFTRLGN